MSAPPPRRANTAFTVGRGLTVEERCAGPLSLAPSQLYSGRINAERRGVCGERREDIADAFQLCADLPPQPPPGERPVALSRHALACAMISLLGYKPASVSPAALHWHRASNSRGAHARRWRRRCSSASTPARCSSPPARRRRRTTLITTTATREQVRLREQYAAAAAALLLRARLNPLRIAGVSLAGFEALMSQKYRFQDVDEKSRQIFRQFDHGKGYITVDVRSRTSPSLLSLILCGCSPKRAVATVSPRSSLSARACCGRTLSRRSRRRCRTSRSRRCGTCTTRPTRIGTARLAICSSGRSWRRRRDLEIPRGTPCGRGEGARG